MNLSSAIQIVPLVAWLLALAQSVSGLYLLALNARHTANRHVSALCLLLAADTFALGHLIRSAGVTGATVPTYILAATSTIIQPFLILTAVALLRPDWMSPQEQARQHRGRRLLWTLAYVVALLPAVLTAADVVLHSGLWYTGLDGSAYAGGYVLGTEYTAGSLSLPVRITATYIAPAIALIAMLSFALRDGKARGTTRWVAWLLLVTQITVVVLQLGLPGRLNGALCTLLANALMAAVYTLAGHQRMIGAAPARGGRLQQRLTALILAFSVPILVAAVAFATDLSLDLSDSPPVAAPRAGDAGLVTSTDDGHPSQAYVDETDDGWRIVLQQPESVLFPGLTEPWQVAATLSVGGALALCVLTWLTVRRALLPVHALAEAAAAISGGDLTRTVPGTGDGEIGILARSVNDMTDQLRGLTADLQQHVHGRTAELERRSHYLEATAQVARESTLTLEPQPLLERVANLISERFGFYHTGIFLLDESREWAVLQAASSEGGRRMMARGHRLRVGRMGIVGYVTAEDEPRVAHDIGEDAVFFDNPDLPETRSELALPLRVRGEVIGALDVQSREAAAFSSQDVEVLQILADQVALAVSNARLFHQTQTALEAERRAYGELRREAWQHRFQAQTGLNYFCDERGVRQVKDPESGPVAAGLPELTVPVSLGDQTLGSIQVHRDHADQWTSEEIALLRTLADQLGLALENARLFGDSQRRAAREQLIAEATGRLRGSLDIDTVLQTAVREIGDTLGLAEVEVRLRGRSGRERGTLRHGAESTAHTSIGYEP